VRRVRAAGASRRVRPPDAAASTRYARSRDRNDLYPVRRDRASRRRALDRRAYGLAPPVRGRRLPVRVRQPRGPFGPRRRPIVREEDTAR
jgi:hypothetical protein